MRHLLRISPTFIALLVAVGSLVGPPEAARAAALKGTSAAQSPLCIISNRGQIADPARYYVADHGSSVLFRQGAVIVSGPSGGPSVRISFPSASVLSTPVGELPLEGRVSYFAGSDSRRWQVGVPTFGEIRYPEIAPGSDVVYKAENGHLKYDLILAPHADLDLAVLRYEGVDRLEIAPDGSLLLHAHGGVLREEAPRLYQESHGTRVPVQGGYRIISNSTLGYWAGRHDPALPLVVDPGMVWSTFVGGNGADYIYGVATDQNGDIYIVGSSASTDFPVSTTGFQRTLKAGSDVVVTKLRNDGRTMVWSTYLGGDGPDDGRAIVVDANGNVTVTGNSLSLNFPVTAGAYMPSTTSARGVEGFVTRIRSGGDALLFSTYLGGSWDDYPRGITLDSSGNPIVAGFTSSSDFPTTAGVVKPTRTPVFPDGADGFIAKLSSSGSSLLLGTYLGTNGGTDEVFSIATDSNDQLTVTGWTLSPGYPVTAGAYKTAWTYDRDGFVTRLNASATGYIFSTFLGDSVRDEPLAVAVDRMGNTFVAGRTSSTHFPTTQGVVQPNYGGGAYDGFVVKLDPYGQRATYSTLLGGSGSDAINGMTIGPLGEVIVVGSTDSNNFPTTLGAWDRTANGGTDAFLAYLAPGGSSLAHATYQGSSGADAAQGVALQPTGIVVMAGQTDNAGFPTTSGAFDTSHNSAGSPDGFISTMDAGLILSAVPESPPSVVSALRAAPNPFGDKAYIDLSMSATAPVKVRVFDAQGRLVSSLLDQELSAGTYRIVWAGAGPDGQRVSTGIYYLEVSTPSGKTGRPLVFIK